MKIIDTLYQSPQSSSAGTDISKRTHAKTAILNQDYEKQT
jgi:hypothetical protein